MSESFTLEDAVNGKQGAFQIKVNKPVLEIKIYYHDEEGKEPLERIQKITQGDFIDLRSAKHYEYNAGDSCMIDLGVSIVLPENYYAELMPRSSTFKKYGLIQTNSVGIIDNSYCGIDDIWKMPVYALRAGEIEKGDRICQFRIVRKMPAVTITEVDADQLGDNRGGFGSTDVLDKKEEDQDTNTVESSTE